VRFERTLMALWRAIQSATEAQDFRPKPGRLCDWCSHQAHCPAFGGELPPFPQQASAAAIDSRQLRLDAARQL
jgi:putative RecB family exonuclease